MGSDVFVTIVMLVLSGISLGLYTSMMIFSEWSWEAKWALYSLICFIVLPWVWACATLTDLGEIYQEASWHALLLAPAMGTCYGVGAVTFGLAVDIIGQSLGFAIILGTCACVGSLMPHALHPSQITESATEIIWYVLSLILHLVGLALSCSAGLKKAQLEDSHSQQESHCTPGAAVLPVNVSDSEHSENKQLAEAQPCTGLLTSEGTVKGCTYEGIQKREEQVEGAKNNEQFKYGLVLGLVSGVASSCLNLGVTFGESIKDTAKSLGNGSMAPNATTAIILTAGSIPGLAYCVHQLSRNGTWRDFIDVDRFGVRHQIKSLGVVTLMSFMWFGSFATYGICVSKIGHHGEVLAWPIWINVMIFSANASGVAQGEWHGTTARVQLEAAAGVLLICASTCVGIMTIV